jgi:nucleoside-diphosphate kinase
MQRTFVMIKPNGVLNGLLGQIISRYETSGLSVSGIRIKSILKTEAEEFYGEHKGREFFNPLIEFMISGPTLLLVLQGHEAIAVARAINGATNPDDSLPGTIRYDYAPNTRMNVVHSSDSVESAERESSFWFKKEELVDYTISKNTAV